jgi:hypothetical protein
LYSPGKGTADAFGFVVFFVLTLFPTNFVLARVSLKFFLGPEFTRDAPFSDRHAQTLMPCDQFPLS